MTNTTLIKTNIFPLVQSPQKISIEVYRNYFEEYLTYRDIEKDSKSKYRENFNAFLVWLEGSEFPTISREAVLSFKESVVYRLKSSTVQNYIGAIKSFFRFLQSQYGIQNVLDGIKPPKMIKEFKKDILEPEQVIELISLDLSLRDKAIINLMVGCGLRNIEITRLKVGDIIEDGSEKVLLITGKGYKSHSRKAVITGAIYSDIMAYLDSRGDLDPSSILFSSNSNRNTKESLTSDSVSRIVRGALKKAGIKTNRITAHSLRHTFASLLLRFGVGITEIKRAMGHSKLDTTLIYVSMEQERNRIKNAPEKVFQDMLNKTEYKEAA